MVNDDPLAFLWADGTPIVVPKVVDYAQQRQQNREVLAMLGCIDVTDPGAMYQEGSDECDGCDYQEESDDAVEKRQRLDIHGYPIFI